MNRREIAGQTVTWDMLLKAQKMFHGQLLTEVLREMELADQQRQHLEDTRSIKRNRNRFMTLIGAVIIGATVVWGFSHMWFGAWAYHNLYPYSFIITVLLDTSLAAYAYVKRY